jgi:N-acetylglutamate synthase-like GNAT family acetyltransferase
MPGIRLAQRADIPVLQDLIALSGRKLSVGYYSPSQSEAITRYVFGVDTQLIDDQTYFVIEHHNRIVACGGWSKRRTLFGGDQTKSGPDPLLDPATESARIRAFFVDPSVARQGFGRQLMSACMDASKKAGFSSLELVSTMPGEPLYLASGFAVQERFELDLPGGVQVPVSRMKMEM